MRKLLIASAITLAATVSGLSHANTSPHSGLTELDLHLDLNDVNTSPTEKDSAREYVFVDSPGTSPKEVAAVAPGIDHTINRRAEWVRFSFN